LVAVAVGSGVLVGVTEGVTVGVGVRVAVAVGVGVFVAVTVGVGVFVGVGEQKGVGVRVGVGVGEQKGVGVRVGVGVGVFVRVGVGATVGVRVGVTEQAAVGVGVGVNVAAASRDRNAVRSRIATLRRGVERIFWGANTESMHRNSQDNLSANITPRSFTTETQRLIWANFASKTRPEQKLLMWFCHHRPFVITRLLLFRGFLLHGFLLHGFLFHGFLFHGARSSPPSAYRTPPLTLRSVAPLIKIRGPDTFDFNQLDEYSGSRHGAAALESNYINLFFFFGARAETKNTTAAR